MKASEMKLPAVFGLASDTKLDRLGFAGFDGDVFEHVQIETGIAFVEMAVV